MTNDQALECGDLRIVFVWRRDRYRHTVERRIGGHWTPLLESVEGLAEIRDAWPPSPALQSLHIERRTSGPVALLVGQAGSSHWSASVEADQDSSALVFDLACRITQRAGHVGSSYRVLQPDAHSLISLVARESDSIGCTKGDSEWTIGPKQIAEPPATIQWRYSIAR
jgi:hypothetical protein